jgi:hypothetical protein
MASYYVYSGAVGAGTGADWANAYTTLATATSGKATSDIFYIAHDHNEATAGTITISIPALGQFLCVNRAGSVPPVAADLMTGAQVKTSGNNAITLSLSRSYWYGVTFIPGDGASGTAAITFSGMSRFERCHFKLASTGVSSTIIATQAVWENTTVEFSATAQGITVGALLWKNTALAIVGTTIPTSLIRPSTNGIAVVEGVDLSAIPSGKAVFSNGNNGKFQSIIKDCKLATGVTVSTALNNWGIAGIDVVRCDDAAANYRHERYHGVGTQTTETTIVRTGGASDGVTPISWKIVTAASASVAMPFESMPISVWNDTTGVTKTVTVEGIWGGGAVPDNNDLWIEVEYLGSATDPQGSFVSSGVATILTTASNYPGSAETWGGSTTKFKMSATTGTIQLKGPITARIFAGLPSSTFYIDPKLTVT